MSDRCRKIKSETKHDEKYEEDADIGKDDETYGFKDIFNPLHVMNPPPYTKLPPIYRSHYAFLNTSMYSPVHRSLYLDASLYCTCNKVSKEIMVSCFGPECKVGWYHLPCIDLKELPKAYPWFCKECAKSCEFKDYCLFRKNGFSFLL